eukprot:Seg229.4 transcript_id=Seg229.4/GoldUCD/mRNA.D3Y31 product="Synaptotagmin 1" protein_id=Seg229.4/GoldUCD/D3Y31
MKPPSLQLPPTVSSLRRANVITKPTNSTTTEKKQHEIVKFILKYAHIVWAYLKTLPIPPYATLGIAGGVLFLIIACLCCCCCRYCCRKKVEKKKAKAKLDLQKYQLHGPDYYEKIQVRTDEIDYNVEASEKQTGKDIQLGRVRFSMSFNADDNIVTVTVIEARDIPAADPSGFSDPYTKVAIIPAGRKEYKTKVKPKTVNPVFEQSFNFKHITYAQLTSSYLHLKVFDYDRFSGHDLLGEAKVPIIDIDLTKPVDEWRILQPEFKMETKGMKKDDPKLGHLCIALAYAPNPQLLAVFILACKDLKSTDEGGFSDPYVKFWIVQDGKKVKKRKTTVKMRTLNPAYNESFLFEIDFEKIEETSAMFIVCDYDKGEKGEPIGELLVGFLGTGAQLKHWTQMRRTPGKPVARWHRLRPPTVTE